MSPSRFARFAARPYPTSGRVKPIHPEIECYVPCDRIDREGRGRRVAALHRMWLHVGRETLVLEAGNLWELIERRAEASPDGQLAVDQTGRAVTFAEYRAACERAAAGLQDLGVGEGNVVSWQLPTWMESMVLVGALSRLSALQNPILPILRARAVRIILRQARANVPR